MKLQEITDLAVRFGALQIRSGTEVRRVEECLYGLFDAYGIRSECFVLLKGVFLTAWDSDGTSQSLIKHIKEGPSTDFQKIEALEEFYSLISQGKLGYREASQRLAIIENFPGVKLAVKTAAAFGTAFLYALFFRGSLWDGLTAGIIALVVSLLFYFKSDFHLHPLLEYFIAGALMGLLSLGAHGVWNNLNVYHITSGTVMILLPGVTLVTGVKDVLHGDTVSSLYRLADALFTIAAVACGITLVLALGVYHG